MLLKGAVNKLGKSVKYLLVLGVFGAVVDLWGVQAVSSTFRFYDVTKLKLHWKICNLEVRIHHHVTVGDWVPSATNDAPWLHIHSITSLQKGSPLTFLLLVAE